MRSLRDLSKSALQVPADALIASSKKLARKIASELYLPYSVDQEYVVLSKSNSAKPDGDGLPIPPQDLWEGYGLTAENFLRSGKADILRMSELLHSSGFRIEPGNRILEFGCASGRMIRSLNSVAHECEVWGVDISARHIVWCQEHLSPPFKFATVTTLPHLPFEDGFFDLIYCGSVFTHIMELADAWLLELARILHAGGRLYVTIHDKHTIDLIMNHPEKIYADGLPVKDKFRKLVLPLAKLEKFRNSDFYMLTIGRGPVSQVFYDVDYLRGHWGNVLDVLSITEEAYSYQTGIVLGK